MLERGTTLFSCGLVPRSIISFSIIWSILNERNERICRRKVLFLEVFTSTVAMRIAKWTVARKDFSNMKNDNMLYYWEACSVSSPMKLRKKVVGCLPPYGILKFNADGATGCKPGPAGVGGVF